MKITSADFVKSAFEKAHWTTDGRPEIAFLGRSNVGKSSLINSLLLRKGLARTSNTPGRTQSINFFLINDEFYFTDLPGYGYARVSKVMRADWGKIIIEDGCNVQENCTIHMFPGITVLLKASAHIASLFSNRVVWFFRFSAYAKTENDVIKRRQTEWQFRVCLASSARERLLSDAERSVPFLSITALLMQLRVI